MIRNVSLTNVAVAENETDSAEKDFKVRVTIHIPDNVSESIKQQKINRLYDILKPKEFLENKPAA